MLPGANRDPSLHGLRLTRSTSSGQAPPPLQQERRLGESLQKATRGALLFCLGESFLENLQIRHAAGFFTPALGKGRMKRRF
ncbi:MAG: hypothetical protein DMF41_08170 [Verrucomicrobia bacterium]|nr:MAG: hypothetical protein DMF41_08170 [Verrucomicrobiota bacterium]